MSLRILYLSEDGDSGIPVLEILVEHLIKRAFPRNGPPVKLERLPPRPVLVGTLRGNQWKDRRKQIDLRRSLATDLAKEDVFVFVHLDGDSAWSTRDERPQGGNRGQWDKMITPGVEAILHGENRAGGLQRLIIVEPFYSIEAWLYQNVTELRRWYTKHHPQAGDDLQHLDEWENDRCLLDEIAKIKESLRIGSQHNLELARQQFPSKEVLKAGKSFAACVERLQDCAPLRERCGS